MRSVVSGSSGASVPRSGWASARRPSEHKRPVTYPPDNEAVSVQHRWPGRVRDLERRAQDPEPLFGGGGGEDGHAINLYYRSLLNRAFEQNFSRPRISTWVLIN